MQFFNQLGEENANNFFRASNSFIQSQKCLLCEPENTTSLALSLLCTSIETLRIDSKKYPFRDWLVHFKLDKLVLKTKDELKKGLRDAYIEYLESPYRTGIRYDFTKLLLEYCPLELRIPPIRHDDKNDPSSGLKEVDFELAVNQIYSLVRSNFVHDSLKTLF